eukprot:14967678-Alexandrium_andersonii.AAC.1
MERLMRCKRCSPGPDGIGYEFWQHAPASFRKVLYTLYLHICTHGVAPDGMNEALLIFLAKG